MKIGMLGSGAMGGTLGTVLARAGHDVTFSYSRSERKLQQLARDAGAHEVIRYTTQDFVAEIKRLTKDAGVQVVYDSVGKTTFLQGFDCLAPRGLMVLFGQSSGPVDPLDPQILNQKGSLFLTRPSLQHYVATRSELLDRADQVLGWVSDGSLHLRIGAEFPLAEAAQAHQELEGRRTTGKLLLIP